MQRKFGERLLSSPQLLDEPPPAYPAMASDASDSARTHALTHTRSLPYLSYLPHGRHTSALCSSLPSLLAPSPRIYLPRALIFHHVIMSLFPTTSVSRRRSPSLHACLRQKWARKQFRPEILRTANTAGSRE